MALRLGYEFDVFQFYFGNSLLGDTLLDVLPLSLLGKKTFFYFCGCDIRDEKHTILNHPISACARCFPKLCNRNRAKAKAVAEQYGRVNFVSTPDLLEFLPRSVLLPQAVDFDLVDEVLKEDLPSRAPADPFIIAHAPTNRLIKGSQHLFDCVSELRNRGLNIELLLIENLSHAEALRKYRLADLAVDQLLVGAYGLLSAELMALGVPTVVYLRPDVLPHYAQQPPLINANPVNLEETLIWWYEHRTEANHLRQDGREYARAVHHPAILAQRCLEFYN
jgi:hypothetical protein